MRRLSIPFGIGLLLALVIAQGSPVSAGTDVVTITGVNEPHDAVVNPLNPHKVAVSAANAVWLSNDEGRTAFAFLTFPFPTGPAPLSYGTCGDSSLAFDSQGRLYWTILGCGTDAGNNSDVGIFVARINFDAGTIDGGFPVCAACGNNPGRDKQWITVDNNPTSPFNGNVYIAWSDIGSGNQIKFMRSTNAGVTWSASANLSNVKGECANDARFPDVMTDPSGNLYVAWHAYCGAANGTTGVINLVRSPNGGADILGGTFMTPVQAFLPGQAEVQWNIQTDPCPVKGSQSLWAGALQPFVITDPVHPGNVYVVADDAPSNDYCNGDQADVVFARSTDFGNSWTRSTVSHAPAGSFQTFPTGAIDQDGRMYVTWYDSREGNTNGTTTNGEAHFLLDRYGTASSDGGLSWTNDFRINDAHFDPDLNAGCFGNNCGLLPANQQTLRIGEYNGAAAANGNGYVSFAGNGSGSQQIFLDVFSIAGQFPDANEPNDARLAATNLGSPTATSVTGTIHTSLDEDFFRVGAHDTGKLTLTLQSDSRASDLDVQAQDSSGNVLETASGTGDTNQIVMPAVAGQTYFVRVFAKPNQFPPENAYSLAIVNTPAPVPFGLVLAPGSDSGRDAHDNVTNDNTPDIDLRLNLSALSGLSLSPESEITDLTDDTPGYKVGVLVDGDLQGFATPTGGGNFSFTIPGGSPLAEGLNQITAQVFIVDESDTAHAVGQGGESGALQLTVDTQAPATPAAPDLLPSSDTGGVSDDNITTIQAPQFGGTGEANTIVRLYASGVQVGTDNVANSGSYIVTSSARNDGVYLETVQLEDLAGNVSASSPSLKVTIANASLTLPGGTASPAGGPVTVDLGAGTVAGYPGIAGASGKVGIVGIPVVNLDANGNSLSVLGTSGDDLLTFTPTGTDAGTVLVGATGQTLHLTTVGSPFSIDPLAGSDVVTVIGSANADTVNATVDTTTTVQVNAFLTASLPIANVERLTINSLDGQDAIGVSATDAVNAQLTVDAGDPAPAQNKAGDSLNVTAASPQGKTSNNPGGPTQGSGIATVSYSKTTNNSTKIAYSHVEKTSFK